MRKSLLLILTAMLAVAVTASIALAAVNVKRFPTASFSGDTVTLTGGNFSGLGSVPAIAEFQATAGVATFTCFNPQGHPSPGQNPVPAQPGPVGTQDLGNADHNGRGTISNLSAHVNAPPTPSAQEVGCGGREAASVDRRAEHADRHRRASRDQAKRSGRLLPQLHDRRASDRHRLLGA